MEESYIIYRSYGLGLINNAVYSYIVGWGDKGTYATNKQIADFLEVSERTISRSLKEFKEKGYIKIVNEGKVNRHIYQGHSVPQERQSVLQSRTECPSSETECPSIKDTETLYNIDNIDNNIKDNIDNNIEEKKEKITKTTFFELASKLISEHNCSQEQAEVILKDEYEIIEYE